MPDEILTDPLQEASRVVAAGAADGLPLASTGGVAVALSCPSARAAPLRRDYGDLDFVARSSDVKRIAALFGALGYEPDTQFNALHGEARLFFIDTTHRREADVFLNAVRGCHELPVSDRLHGPTLTTADLLLSKLQVRETNHKDLQDIYALLIDHDFTDDDAGISRARLTEICGNDWGWWRTVTEVTHRAQAGVRSVVAEETVSERVSAALGTIRSLIDEAPKTRRWRMRARVGERVRWYETPEELEH